MIFLSHQAAAIDNFTTSTRRFYSQQEREKRSFFFWFGLRERERERERKMSDRKHTIMFLAADYDGDGTVRVVVDSLVCVFSFL